MPPDAIHPHPATGCLPRYTFHGDHGELSRRLESIERRLQAQGIECVSLSFDDLAAVLRPDMTAAVTCFVESSRPAAGPTSFLESSTALFGELMRHEIWVSIRSDTDPERRLEVVRTLDTQLCPFSEAEISELGPLNPRVSELVDHYQRAGVAVDNVNLFVKDHLLLEKVNLLSALFNLGFEPRKTVVISKADKTFYRNRVFYHLRARGVTVLESDTALHDLPLVSDCQPGEATVIVDDGADLIRSVLARAPRRRLIAIETTAKGMRVLRSTGLADQVVNLSDTPVKYHMSRSIAASCVHRFRELLRHAPLADERCIVVGYGRLGRHVSELLRGCGMDVTVAEVDSQARESALQAGFPVADSIEQAADPTIGYLFGCSGVQSVGVHAVQRLSPTSVLCALSSQDLVRAIRGMREIAEVSPVRGVGTRYKFGGRTVTVLADGHAVNLHYAEGVNEPDFDAFTALIGVAVVESARYLLGDCPLPTSDEMCAIAAASTSYERESSLLHNPVQTTGEPVGGGE